MVRNVIYWIFGGASLSALLLAAPSGAWLTVPPARGQIVRDAQGKTTVRGSSTRFVWLGGGYHGGK